MELQRYLSTCISDKGKRCTGALTQQIWKTGKDRRRLSGAEGGQGELRDRDREGEPMASLPFRAPALLLSHCPL